MVHRCFYAQNVRTKHENSFVFLNLACLIKNRVPFPACHPLRSWRERSGTSIGVNANSGSQSFFGLRFSAGMSQDSLRVTSHIASLTSTNKPRKYFQIIYAPFSFISIKVTK